MGTRYLRNVLCTLLLVTTVIANELSIDIDVGEGGIDLTVDLADHDPCEGHKCPKGDVCKVIIHPRLLQLPVPHCVQNGSREEGPCRECTVGSNMMNCRTEEQWRMVGGKQCALRGNTPSTLTQTQVHHACHSLQIGEGTKFLSATFTCCPPGYKPSTSPPPTSAPSHAPTSAPSYPPTQHETVTYQQRPSTDAPDTGNHVGEEKMEDKDSSMYYIPVALGLLTLAAVVLVMFSLLHRYRHKRSFKAPPEPVTCYVNLSSEGFEEGGGGGWEKEKDTSLLITNKHFSSSK